MDVLPYILADMLGMSIDIYFDASGYVNVSRFNDGVGKKNLLTVAEWALL